MSDESPYQTNRAAYIIIATAKFDCLSGDKHFTCRYVFTSRTEAEQHEPRFLQNCFNRGDEVFPIDESTLKTKIIELALVDSLED